MKFLIAGLGSIGRRHLRNLVSLGETDIILYRTYQSTLPEDDLVGFPVVTNLARGLADNPDAVIIANPTALHLDIAIPAAKAGCHLLLEKPVSNSMERVGELEKFTQRTGARVLVGFQFRFHPGLQQAKQLLEAGAIGRPLSARAVYGEYLPEMHPWEDFRDSYSSREDLGGGVMLTLCHPLDTLRWLLGEVEAVWAFSGQLNDFDLSVEDTALIGLRFSSGAIGSVQLDYNHRPPVHELEVVGTQGRIRWESLDGAVEVFQAEKGWQRFPVLNGFERNRMYLAEMEHFLTVIQGESQPACTLEDGIRALDLVLAARRSSDNRVLVKLVREVMPDREAEA